MRQPGSAAADWWYFTVVGAYLSAVMCFLLISGRLDPDVSFGKVLRSILTRRVKAKIQPAEFNAETGCCYICTVPPSLMSDKEGQSRLKLFEDGRLLGPAHCAHDEVRQSGKGRYSHWSNYIYLSASDNSDPRTNGRTYTYEA